MDATPKYVPLNEEVIRFDQPHLPPPQPTMRAQAVMDGLAGRARLRSEARRAEAHSDGPPTVTRGAKSADVPPCPDEGVFTSVDWFRTVGPEELVPSLIEWCTDNFGPGRPAKGGRFNTQGGFEFESGASLLTGHASGLCILELNGGALSTIDGDKRVELMRELLFRFGMVATRLDIARDYVGQGVRLFDQAYEAVKQRQHVGCRKPRIVATIDAEGEDGDGRTIYMGKGGKAGSGRMVRIYDKGKEQKIKGIASGYWERWETQFSKDLAHVAALVLCGEWDELDRWCKECPEERLRVVARNNIKEFRNAAVDWVHRASSLALHAMDFREVVTSISDDGSVVRVRDLDRRPRVPWFQELVDGLASFRLRAVRRFPTLVRWGQWMKTAVIPTVKAMVDRTGGTYTLESMFRKVIGMDVAAAEPGKRSVLWEWIKVLRPDGSVAPSHWTLSEDWKPPRLSPLRYA